MLNKYIMKFPGANQNKKYRQNKLKEIIMYALPKSWQNKFDKLGFDLKNKEDTMVQPLKTMEAQE